MISMHIISSAILMEALAGQPKPEPQQQPVIGAPTPASYSYTFTQVPVFQFQRHRRTATEIELRAEEVVSAFAEFDIELDEDVLEAWAQEAVLNSDRFVWARPVIDHPNIVVGYHRQFDDVFIIDEFLPNLERHVGPGQSHQKLSDLDRLRRELLRGSKA